MLQADVESYAALPATSALPIDHCDLADTKTRRKRRYIFTEQIDQRIREIYLNHPDAKARFYGMG